MSCKKYKVTFSTVVESDTPDNTADEVSYNLSFILGDFMLDDCIEIDKNIESVFDLEEYN